MAEYSNLVVVLMGMGVVFFGLICIILLTMAMGKLMQEKDGRTQAAAPGKSEPEVQRPDVRPEVLAAILTVLSEDAGTTPYGLNIVDIKKIK